MSTRIDVNGYEQLMIIDEPYAFAYEFDAGRSRALLILSTITPNIFSYKVLSMPSAGDLSSRIHKCGSPTNGESGKRSGHSSADKGAGGR
jgi:hypothetical protein